MSPVFLNAPVFSYPYFKQIPSLVLFVLIVLLFSISSVFAKTPQASPAKNLKAGLVVVNTIQPLTLEQAFEQTMENNPTVKALKAQAEVSKAQVVTASARLNPSIMSDNGVAEKTYRLGVQQTFELGGKRKNRIAVATAQQALTASAIAQQLLAIRAEVRKTYTQVYNLQERQAVMQEVLITAQHWLDLTEKRDPVGDVAMVDVLQAEIMMVNARNESEWMGYQVVEARNRLNTLLNKPLGTSLWLTAPPTTLSIIRPPTLNVIALPVQSGLTELSLVQFLTLAREHHPEVQQTLQALRVIERQLTLVKSTRIPNVNLAVGFDKTTGEGGENSVFVMGTLELPLLNRQEGAIQEALAKKTQLEAEHTAFQSQLTLEVTNAYGAWQAHKQRVTNYEQSLLPKARLLVEKARCSFEAGKVSVLTAITVQQAFSNNYFGYLQALQDFQNALTQLELAIGVPL